eukprot:CAMPEP_0117540098 /NCGR_PEP_ID=MMETSP0784-20121206/43324_1 /TAXON_ID=39447 /ORGANISM="" /LENGTH=44 /DNA_ID= /DNA_START= /DNA_END= /DNA_ORIENTATION=
MGQEAGADMVAAVWQQRAVAVFPVRMLQERRPSERRWTPARTQT